MTSTAPANFAPIILITTTVLTQTNSAFDGAVSIGGGFYDAPFVSRRWLQDNRDADRCWIAAECSSPPPVPLDLASEPDLKVVPLESLTAVVHAARVARMRGGVRERRPLRRRRRRSEGAAA